MSERYRVPKFKVPVEIRTLDGTRQAASLFLGERAEEHSGPEGPLDLLNGACEFIVVEVSGGEVSFLRRGSVSVVTLATATTSQLSGAEVDPVVAGLFVEAKLKLVLEDGSELEGATHYELPEQSRRVLDFLNGPERFVPLTHEGGVSFVNKRCIARALPL